MKTPNMKRWSDPKLDMELTFAKCAVDDGHPESVAWLEACTRELHRRSGAIKAA